MSIVSGLWRRTDSRLERRHLRQGLVTSGEEKLSQDVSAHCVRGRGPREAFRTDVGDRFAALVREEVLRENPDRSDLLAEQSVRPATSIEILRRCLLEWQRAPVFGEDDPCRG